jgi:flagellar hook-associated protein 3 FlgL
MRVTAKMALAAVTEGTTRSVKRLTAASRVASTGERMTLPSDDPARWAQTVGHDARLRGMESRARSSTQAAGDLELAETALAHAGDLVLEVRELALRGVNGSLDHDTRRELGRQVAGLRESLLGIANTRGASGYLFAGTRTDRAPFDSTGAFLGNDGEVRLAVTETTTARSNASGARAFTTAGGRDLLADLQSLSTALSIEDLGAIRGGLDALDAGHRQLLSARTEAGLGAERLRVSAEVTQTALVHARAARAATAEADLPAALTALTEARSAYERGVAVTREVLSLSSLSRG